MRYSLQVPLGWDQRHRLRQVSSGKEILFDAVTITAGTDCRGKGVISPCTVGLPIWSGCDIAIASREERYQAVSSLRPRVHLALELLDDL